MLLFHASILLGRCHIPPHCLARTDSSAGADSTTKPGLVINDSNHADVLRRTQEKAFGINYQRQVLHVDGAPVGINAHRMPPVILKPIMSLKCMTDTHYFQRTLA